MGKTGAFFTLVVQRWYNSQPDLFRSGTYCYHVIATNDYQRSPCEIVRFHNQRANAENYNKEIKSGFGMEYAPSQQPGANRVYLEIGVLAYNLCSAMRPRIAPAATRELVALHISLLNSAWQHKTIATLRWELLLIAGKVIRAGRRPWLKVVRGHLELLSAVRARLDKVLASQPLSGLT